MSKFKTETAYEIDGVYFVDTEFEGRPVTISVRTADTTGTPLSETEALKALKATSFHTNSVDLIEGCSRDNKIPQAL
jgi:hypothetical protein